MSVETVAKVGLDKYVGKWYELAAFPLVFKMAVTRKLQPNLREVVLL